MQQSPNLECYSRRRNADIHCRHANPKNHRARHDCDIAAISEVNLMVNEHLKRIVRNKPEYDDRDAANDGIGNSANERPNFRAETTYKKTPPPPHTKTPASNTRASRS